MEYVVFRYKVTGARVERASKERAEYQIDKRIGTSPSDKGVIEKGLRCDVPEVN